MSDRADDMEIKLNSTLTAEYSDIGPNPAPSYEDILHTPQFVLNSPKNIASEGFSRIDSIKIRNIDELDRSIRRKDYRKRGPSNRHEIAESNSDNARPFSENGSLSGIAVKSGELSDTGSDLAENQTYKALEIEEILEPNRVNSIISQNPWQIDVKATFEKFKEMGMNDYRKKFRLGGILLYTGSRILSAKSDLVLRHTQETKEEIEIEEIPPEEDYDPAEFDYIGEDDFVDDLEGVPSDEDNPVSDNNRNERIKEFFKSYTPISFAGSGTDYSLVSLDIGNGKGINGILAIDENLPELNAEQLRNLVIPTYMFFNVDSDGSRYLASPLKRCYRRIEPTELGKALNRALKRTLYNTVLEKKPKKKDKKSLIKEILPESILIKAEEKRAQVELQLKNMFNKIRSLYIDGEPVRFIDVIIGTDTRQIVQSLLYLLHLVNRNKIILWQELDDPDDDDVRDPTGKNPEERGDTGDISGDKEAKREKDPVNIYIQPIASEF